MMNTLEGKNGVFILLTVEEWREFTGLLKLVAQKLDEISSSCNTSPAPEWITAIKFMDAVGIKRTHFDSLVAQNKIKTRKKSRKIYVLATEVKRYFDDPTI